VPGNVLVALSPNLGEAYRDFAREFSIEFDERDTTLYDPSSTSVSGDKYVVDVPTNYTFSPSQDLKGHSNIISALTKGSGLPVKYSGVVHQTIDIPLLLPLLRAPSTAFPIEIKSSGEVAPVEGGPLVAGESAKLVSGFQSRVNSRVVWSGSLDLFSDKLWTPESSNQAFVEDVTKWLFGEKGVMEVVQSKHYPTKDPSQGMKEQYRIGEEMVSYSREYVYSYEANLCETRHTRSSCPSTKMAAGQPRRTSRTSS
jgi:oligosaccharyltransferase complex subunit beta